MRESQKETNCSLRQCPSSNQKFAQTSDTQTAARIFDEYESFLMTVISSKFSSQPDVDIEDLFQDLFLSLTERPIPSDVGSVKSYLSRSISNDIKDQYRKAGKYRAHCRSLYLCRSHKHLCNRDNPATLVENKDTIRYLRRIIKEYLPEHEAVAVTQRLNLENCSIKTQEDKANNNKRSFSRSLCTGLKRLRKLCPDLI